MKNIEDIEKMSVRELECAAENSRVEIPGGLKAGLERAISREIRRRTFVRCGAGAAIVTAACIMAIILMPGNPKDSFNDPEEAYAQIEKTFSLISSKMERGLEIVSNAEPAVEKTNGIYNNKRI